MGGRDCKVWGASKNGHFIVKSAYHIALSILLKTSIHLPEAGSSFEAGKENMWSQGASEVGFCPVYESAAETVDHVLCNCPFVILVWKLCPLRLDFSAQQPSLWPKRWEELCEGWAMFETPKECMSLEFRDISRQTLLLSLPPPLVLLPLVGWVPPPAGFLKLNFDVAFNHSTLACDGGVILHNSFGQPIKVASMFLLDVCGPSMAESLILREPLLLLKRWRFSKVVIEGDCLSVMKLNVSEDAQ
ncbi:uncharacterized protein LOC132295867 [Cornus florida]|uniref:uncharacterized protein LOC132295867 n=1 Tax=Cornus florida TaxID=4283 RepID=UPI00289D0C67|nr:uncharacterized protein LOC132295867 [Cornus florida]